MTQSFLLISDLSVAAAGFSVCYLIGSIVLAFLLEARRNIQIPADLDAGAVYKK